MKREFGACQPGCVVTVSQDRVTTLEVVLLSKVELASLASLMNYDCVLMLNDSCQQ